MRFRGKGKSRRVLVPAHEGAQLLNARLLVGLLLVIIFKTCAFPDLLEVGLELLEFHRTLPPKLEETTDALVHDVAKSQRRLRPRGNLQIMAEHEFLRAGVIHLEGRGAELELLPRV